MLVEQGKLEELDLSEFGVAAFYNPQKGAQVLQVFTAHKVISVSSQGLAGDAGTDLDGKLAKQLAFAKLLFAAHAER